MFSKSKDKVVPVLNEAPRHEEASLPQVNTTSRRRMGGVEV
jgi:hypothetical protein